MMTVSMYRDYLNELKQYDKELDLSEAELFDLVYFYNHDEEIETIEITDRGIICGFLVVAFGRNCHPLCDYFIEQAYIEPSHRRKHIMSDAIVDYVQNHKGIYCFDILKGNDVAESFWHKTFHSVGYERTYRFEDSRDPHYTRDVNWYVYENPAFPKK